MSNLQYHNYNLRKRPLSNLRMLDEVVDVDEVDELHDDKLHNEDDGDDKNAKRFSVHFVVVAITSFITRLLYINSSSIVVWDEAHFGKFASWYIKRIFYFDVHPPLGKLLIAFSGWLFNYNGSFSFESGSTYDDTVPILQMRIFSALFGAFAPMFIYGIGRNVGFSRSISFMTASLVIFDNAMVTISKFVLLDSMLLCFTAMSVYCITRFEKEEINPFTRPWYRWLRLTGVSLGIVLSVKWVGLFTYAFVGLFTVRQLWNLLPVLKVQPRTYGNHFLQRALHLIAIPAVIYMGVFYVHFVVLVKSGNGDTHMSSRFQANLLGSKIAAGPPTVMVEHDYITLKNHGYGGGLLHSHVHGYPTGSKQGQVTLYHHRDNNNFFQIRRSWKSKNNGDVELGNKDAELGNYVKNGDVIRLFHNVTRRNLHSHNIPAPLSVFEYEVSTYGNETLGDPNDHWIVETTDNKSSNEGIIQRLTTTFRLKHQSMGCYLSGSGERLPEWGFQQMEVVCMSEKNDKRTLWNIEEIVSNRTDAIEKRRNRKGYDGRYFLQDFLDLNVAMWYGNNALTPKTSKKDLLRSTPSQWMFLEQGLRMCNWREETVKYYLLGNPFVWWVTGGSVFVYVAIVGFHYLKGKMLGYTMHSEEQLINNGFLYMMGWMLHYVPFFVMGRVTYLHHYFPSVMLLTILTGHLVQNMRKVVRGKVATLVTLVSFISFVYFAPLSYGFVGKPEDIVPHRMWRIMWNIM